jgi:hypothetical protein
MNAEESHHDRDFAAPLGRVSRGRLEFARGASLVSIAAADMPELYRAHFEGPVPRVRAHAGDVAIQYRRLSLAEWARYALLWGHHAAEIALNRSIPWRIVVRGGVAKLSADLRGLHLGEFVVAGGASEAEVLLPRPAGVVVVRVAGGASNVTLRRPEGVAVEVRVRRGVSRLTFDDQHFGAIGGDARLGTPGCARAADRYAIEVAGGASSLAIALW